MFQKITNDNVIMFAIKNYDNPQCEGESEFYDDMKRFKYIKRLLRKYREHAEAGSTLMIFKIESEFWPILKSFMNFLGMIPEDELSMVDEDETVKKVLERL